VNFTFHWSLIRGRGVGIYRDDPEVRLLTGIGVGAGIAFAAAMMAEGTSFGGALRAGLFSSFSMLTTTGFVVDPGIAAGSTLVVPMGLMVLALIGGATGSTAGGIKLLRFWLLLKLMLREVHRAPHPRSIVRIVYAGHFVDDSPLRGTLAFFAAYLLSIAFVGIGLAAVGVDFGAAVTSAAAAISNTGPAGDLAGGAVATGLGGSSGRIGEFYAGMPDAAKWILSGAMLLGRLEIFALLALVAAVFRRN
jgi:trk system potassium uptake protein TrkH